jgi:hypothetical protein
VLRISEQFIKGDYQTRTTIERSTASPPIHITMKVVATEANQKDGMKAIKTQAQVNSHSSTPFTCANSPMMARESRKNMHK